MLRKQFLLSVLVGFLSAPSHATNMVDTGDFYYPNIEIGKTGIFAMFNELTIDAAGEKVASIFQIPKTGTVSKVASRIGSIGGNDVMAVWLENVSTTTGHPDGTMYGGSSTGTYSILSTDDNLFFLVTLGSPATALAGDIVALVVGSTKTTPTCNCQANGMSGTASQGGFPYIDTFTAGAWTKIAGQPMATIEYSDGSRPHIPGVFPAIVGAGGSMTTTFSSATAGANVYGTGFWFNFNARMKGWVANTGYGSTASSATWTLTQRDESTGTVVGTVVDNPFFNGTQITNQSRQKLLSSPVTLTANTTYYLTMQPISTNTVNMQIYQLESSAQQDEFGWGGMYSVSSLDNNAIITSTQIFTSSRPAISLILDQIDIGSGGGASNMLMYGVGGDGDLVTKGEGR